MVRMGDIWDRTTQVLGGRAGMLAPIAALTIFLPSIVRDAYVAYGGGPEAAGYAAIGGVLSILVVVATLWGQLALLAIASDPDTTRAAAQAQATARIGPAIGVTIVLGLVALVLALPPIVALVQSGVDLSAMTTPGARPVSPPPGVSLFVGLYFLAYLLVAFWVGARLVLVNPVVLHERLGLGAIRRSWQLTRGLTWRIIGVVVLFVIVLLVAAGAAQFIVGIVLRLILGEDGVTTATFLGGVAGTAVTTLFTVIAAVFTAQLYVAVARPAAAGGGVRAAE